MAWTTPKVEVSFTTNPLDDPVWEDVTDDVVSIDIRRGRSSELSTFSAGSCSVVLRNDDRRYDPTHSAGPHYGNLVPKRRIQVTADLGEGETPLYTGFVNGFPMTVDYLANRAYCQLDAVDALEFLASTPMPSSAYRAVAMGLKPWVFYPLDDDLDTLQGYINDLSRNRTLAFESGLSWEDYPGPYPIDIKRHAVFNGNAYVALPSLHPDDAGFDTREGITLAFWLKADVLLLGDPMIVIGLDDTFRVAIDRTATANQGKLFVHTRESTPVYLYSDTSAADSQWHHWLIIYDGTKVTIYRDGVFEAQTPSGDQPIEHAGTSAESFIGRPPRLQHPSWPAAWLVGAQMHSVLILPYGLTAFNALWPAVSGWPGQLAHTRIKTLLDTAGWPTELTSAPNSQSTMQPTPELSGSLLDCLQRVADSEAGALFVRADGVLRFNGRHTLWRSGTGGDVQAVFGDGPEDLRYVEGNPSQDISNLHNSAIVQRKDGAEQVVEDQASIDAYWRRGQGIRKSDLLLTSDLEARAYAEWLLWKYSQPTARVEDVTLDARASTEVLEQCVIRELQDRIVFKRKPNNVGEQVSYEGLIEGISHSINLSQRTWQTVFNLAPVEATQVFQFDHAVRGKLDNYAMGY